jgi:hypothetical protein
MAFYTGITQTPLAAAAPKKEKPRKTLILQGFL